METLTKKGFKSTRVNFEIKNIKKVDSVEASRLLASAGTINRGLANLLRTRIVDQINAQNIPCLIDFEAAPGEELNERAAKNLAILTNTWFKNESNMQYRVKWLFNKNAFLLVTTAQYEKYNKA